MSVTFINEDISNFDNVIMLYPQYLNYTTVLYQLCRYLFNYTNWSDSNIKKIKKTKVYSDEIDYHQSCIEYKKQIDIIDNMFGSLRTLDEVSGNITLKIKQLPKEKKNDKIAKYATKGSKLFKVYPDSDSASTYIIFPKVYNFMKHLEVKK